MYLTYEEYQNMGGTLDETTFADFEFEARCRVDWWTFNRLKDMQERPEALTRCMYKLIKLLQDIQAATGTGTGADGSAATSAGVSSMSNDGVSLSFNVMSASEIATSANTQIDTCIRQYLADVRNSLGQKVLYRGLYPNE